jgi:hypothetical protein
MPVYEEKINENYPFAGGLVLWALAVGLVPGILLGGVWWLTTVYIALTVAIIASFFRMKVALFEDRLVVRFGFVYRKTIRVKHIQDCAPYRIAHPMKNYGGWGIRKGRDGTFAITQAFVNDAVKLEMTGQTYVISSRTPERLCEAIKGLKK